MTNRVSQIRDVNSDRYTTDKADKIRGAIQIMRPDWTTHLEHQDAFSIQHPDSKQEAIEIWFGPANATWGASVTNDEGADLAYLETGLSHDSDAVFSLAIAAIHTVEGWIEAGMPQCHYGNGNVRLFRLSHEIALTVIDELRAMVHSGDDENSIAGQITRARDEIRSFVNLHDYCDANTLGKQESIYNRVSAITNLSDGNEYVNACMQVQNWCQSEVHLWIQTNGLRKT